MLLMDLSASRYVTTWVPLPKCQSIRSWTPTAFRKALRMSAVPIDSSIECIQSGWKCNTLPSHRSLDFMPLKVFIAYAGFMHFILFTLLLNILHICLQGKEAILMELPTHRQMPDRSYLSHHNMAFIFKEEKWIIDACFCFLFFSPSLCISFLSQLPISTILAPRMGTGSQ